MNTPRNKNINQTLKGIKTHGKTGFLAFWHHHRNTTCGGSKQSYGSQRKDKGIHEDGFACHITDLGTERTAGEWSDHGRVAKEVIKGQHENISNLHMIS